MVVRAVAVLGALGFFSASVSCGSDHSANIRVFGASSLAGALGEATTNFESNHPGVKVTLTLGSSAMLATQIIEGAPASVFVSANEAQMQRLSAAGEIVEQFPLVSNSLVILSSSARIRSFADLAQPGVRLILAARDVPLGTYAREAIARASQSQQFGPGFEEKVLGNLRSEEGSAGAVVAKLELGEADAAIVYASDTFNRPGLSAVSIPPEFNVVARYPIGVVRGGGTWAEQFVEFLRSPNGQSIFAKYGFAPP